MSTILSNLSYVKTHEWVKYDTACQTATVGITDYAQSHLGDIVFVDLPECGRQVTAGHEIAVIESVKGVSDIYAPVSGTVTETNGELADNPAAVNEKPYESWLFRIRVSDTVELTQLLDAAGYQKVCDGE